MSDFILTDDNYYSPEADMHYMSCSQLQGFDECEAKALAKLQGRWRDVPSKAFLVGNFFHSYFESKESHVKFCADNAEMIYTKASLKGFAEGKGEPQLLTDFQHALKMISVLEEDPVVMKLISMEGQNEKFMTGNIFGVPWRMKMDKYVPSTRYILDYKTVANIWETAYDAVRGERVTFIEAYGYLFRAAVYSLIEAQNVLSLSWDSSWSALCSEELVLPNFMLICVSKQDYPDKEIIRMNHRQEYIYELEQIRQRLVRYTMIKEGVMPPKRCGRCDYCRATKKITRIMPYYELKPEFRAPQEEDYNAPAKTLA